MRLVYLSPVFARSYAQRPHFAVEAWLKLGASRVAWLDPYPVRLPRWQDLRRGRRGLHDQGTRLDPRVSVLGVRSLPIEPLPGGSWVNRHVAWRQTLRTLQEFVAGEPWVLGAGRPCALALTLLRELRPDASFYDAMDNFPEFHQGLSRRSLARCEAQLAEQVDLIVASSDFLVEKFARRGLRVARVLNGYPMSSLAAWHPPADRPLVLGYLGSVGRWFDWPTVLRLARQLPQAQIELVGPCMNPPPTGLPSSISLLPACPQGEAAGHLARFSAGLIPFSKNPLTDGVDPIKYYEYRASGLPVLTTSFGQMNSRGEQDGVYFLDREEPLPAVVAKALAQTPDERSIAQFRRENDWAMRFNQPDAFCSLLPRDMLRRSA
jgi:hypothetical protein